VTRARDCLPIVALAVLLIFSAILALLTGNGELAWPASAADWRVVTELRLPRIAGAGRHADAGAAAQSAG